MRKERGDLRITRMTLLQRLPRRSYVPASSSCVWGIVLLAICLVTFSLSAEQTSSSIDVPQGVHLLLQAKGKGVQIYTCTSGEWTLKAPDAKLLDARGKVIGSHFAGPTWQLTDGSQLKAKAIGSQPSPETTAVAWLLLQALPDSGTGKFANITYIRRTETHGGVAPNKACASGETRVPYTATYSFYEK
jgi:uncharacterized protein DUF3455